MGGQITSTIDGVLLTPLKIIDTPGGDVFHGLKTTDPGYDGFGEAYFSFVENGVIKAWKRHRRMTLNLVVPIGEVRFVIFDDRPGSASFQRFQEVTLSKDNYYRLTVPPMLWVGFQGRGEDGGMLLNIASIPHDPEESDRKSPTEIMFDWKSH